MNSFKFMDTFRVHLASLFLWCDLEAVSWAMMNLYSPCLLSFSLESLFYAACFVHYLKTVAFFFFHFWFYFIRQNGKSSPCYSTTLYKEIMTSEKVAGSEVICQRTRDSNNESSKVLKPILQSLQIR